MPEDIQTKIKTPFISMLVFVIALITTIISLTSVVFPALIVRLTSDIDDNAINPFEPGIWALPFFIINGLFFLFLISYYKKKIPNKIQNVIRFISNFEVTRKTALITLVILFSIYIGFTIGELFEEESWDDYEGVKEATDTWTIDGGKGVTIAFKYFLLYSSVIIFHNIRMIPFISSILLLLVTYFTTVEITKKRFSGIVALIILLQSNNFLTYDTSSTYSSFWIFFYVVSIYLICKKWFLSPISYIFSVFSKGITAIFIPMTFFFIYRSEISNKKKIKAFIPYSIILSLFIALSTISIPVFVPLKLSFRYYDLWNGFTSLAFQLRFDGLVLMFLLPLIVGLIIMSRRNILHADSILIFITGALLSAPLLSGLTEITLQPYRQLSLVVFFAIGAGVIFSKRSLDRSKNLPN